MKISELIVELEKLKKRHGDLPVYQHSFFEVDDVYFERKQKFEDREDLPDRIMI